MMTTIKTANWVDDNLKEIAQGWLATGATTAGLWDGEAWAWQAGMPSARHPDLHVPLPNTNVMLALVGLSDAGSYHRLKLDAKLLSRLRGLESELESFTEEFIENQDQLLALYDLTHAMRAPSKLDLHATLRTIARETKRLVKSTGALLFLEHGNQHHFEQYPPQHTTRDEGQGMHEAAKLNGKHILLNGGELPDFTAFHSIIVQPLPLTGEAHGVLALTDKRDGDFTAADLKLVRTIAEQAAAQIENILLHHEALQQERLLTEMKLAQQVQLSLLPQHLPKIAGLDLFAMSSPASQVGGDFYDVMHQPDSPFTFTMGDIAGKGLSAALLMSMTKTIIRGATHYISDAYPGQILHIVNDELYDDFSEIGTFCTVFLGQYQPGEILFANAGHSPVVYCPQGQAPQLLRAPDIPLGLLPGEPFEEIVLPFAPGDLLVIATDGFVERSSPDEELFGYDRFMQIIHTGSQVGMTATEIGQNILYAIEQFADGHPQDDDQTLMVIRATP